MLFLTRSGIMDLSEQKKVKFMKKNDLRAVSCLLAVLLLLAGLSLSAFAALRGDADLNGTVEPADARLALRASVGLETLSEQQFAAADMDANGEIEPADARAILRLSVGLGEDENDQYDIIRSSNWYIVGTVTDRYGSSPFTMAKSGGTVYMESDFEGTPMGILLTPETGYLSNISEKLTLELSRTVLSLLGIREEDLIDSGKFGFGSFPSKSLAAADEVTENGSKLTVYSFTDEGEAVKVFMNGPSLVRIERGTGENASVLAFTLVSGIVPADKKAVPSGFTLLKGTSGLFEFMSSFDF